MSSEHFDLEGWPTAEPPDDFADRVLSALDHGERRRRRSRLLAGGLGASVLALAAAVALFVRPVTPVASAPAPGELLADETREIEIAPGARAVVERYAHLVWSAAGVVQDRGDVFYRLAPGVHLDVRTPAGAISSEGACSRVKIMIADAGPPTVLIAVAQGQVEVRGGTDRVVLAAGRYARVDAGRIRTDADDTDGSMAYALAHDRVHRYAEALHARPPEELTAPPPVTAPKPVPRIPSAPPAIPSASAAASAPPVKRTLRVPRCECQPSDSLCACFDLVDAPIARPPSPFARAVVRDVRARPSVAHPSRQPTGESP